MTFRSSPTVFVIDDDVEVRTSIQRLLKSAGMPLESFETAEEFLRNEAPDGPSCLVLDVSLPGAGGLELQRQLAHTGVLIPINFITGQGDIRTTVKAMKTSAVQFLTGPFVAEDSWSAIQQAFDQDSITRSQQGELAELQKRYESPTARAPGDGSCGLRQAQQASSL